VVLDAEGVPVSLEISGRKSPVGTWEERFERKGGSARWSTPVASGKTVASGPAYYVALNPAHDRGMLARALLRRADRTLPLLPEGTASLEPMQERTVLVEGRSRHVRLYAIHGLHIRPVYVWLDTDGATFADEWAILEGWEPAFRELRQEISAAIDDKMQVAARAMGMDERLGSVEPGKLADLLLVDGDPTAEISDIRRVMTVVKGGRVCDPAAIYRVLGMKPDGPEDDLSRVFLEVEDAVWAFHAADTAPNAEGLIDLLWPEFTLLADGASLTYRDVAAGSRQFMASLELFNTEWSDLEVVPLGGDAAISSFTFRDSPVSKSGDVTRSTGQPRLSGNAGTESGGFSSRLRTTTRWTHDAARQLVPGFRARYCGNSCCAIPERRRPAPELHLFRPRPVSVR
jgi:hypothetical protein